VFNASEGICMPVVWYVTVVIYIAVNGMSYTVVEKQKVC
jgi:hypothetical protein